jgi:hypothetical protein
VQFDIGFREVSFFKVVARTWRKHSSVRACAPCCAVPNRMIDAAAALVRAGAEGQDPVGTPPIESFRQSRRRLWMQNRRMVEAVRTSMQNMAAKESHERSWIIDHRTRD